MRTADVGAVGRSEFYELPKDPEEVAVSTPYGDPVVPLEPGTVASRRVCSVPRHGAGHAYPRQASEMRLCYATRALVTDLDASVERRGGVGQVDVSAMFERNLKRVNELLIRVIGDLPKHDGRACLTRAGGIELIVYGLP